jgi:hypothetical protein
MFQLHETVGVIRTYVPGPDHADPLDRIVGHPVDPDRHHQ